MNREKHEKAAKKYAEVITAHKKRKKRGDVLDISEVDQVQEADDNEEHSATESAAGSKKPASDGRRSDAEAKTKGDEGSNNDDAADGAMSINSDMTAADVYEANADNVF